MHSPKLQSIIWNGKPVYKPGMYDGVPLDIYHSQQICVGSSVSSSGLRRILADNRGSPAHFYAEWSGNPDRVETEDKPHLVVGRAVHHLLLGQPNFSKLFIIRPEEYIDSHGEVKKWSGNSKVCRQWVRQAESAGRIVLKQEDVDNIKGMATMLGRDPLVRTGILSGMVERSLIWQDKMTGLWLKARPDAIPTYSGDFADLKTTTSVQFVDLMRTISDFAYHQQAALIRTGAREVLGLEMTSYALIFVEKKVPYCPRVVMLKQDDIDLGEKQNRAAIDLIARCIKEKRWPSPGDGLVTYIELTEPYRKRATETLSNSEAALPQSAGRRVD